MLSTGGTVGSRLFGFGVGLESHGDDALTITLFSILVQGSLPNVLLHVFTETIGCCAAVAGLMYLFCKGLGHCPACSDSMKHW